MNKTVTINISGIIFHIEEDAYDKLSKYLNTIKGYFSKTDGGNEIMSDIEARIAEMLQSKTSAVKQVVLMSDVDFVMESMGKPEEFAGDTTETQTDEKHNDTDADYEQASRVKKRLYRDGDSKVLGGVCSGIGHYFGIDPVWLRIALLLLFFFAGSGILLYIILWIAIPVAKTTTEKLAMKGERADINNISKAVKEEAEHLKKRMDKYGKEFRNMANNNGGEARNFVEKVVDFLADVFLNIGKVLLKIIGVILVIIGVTIFLGLFTSVFGISFMTSNIELQDWINVVLLDGKDFYIGFIGIFIFIGVPVLMLIYFGIKILFKITYTNRWLNLSAGVLWMVGLIIILFVGIKTGQDFNKTAKVRETVSVATNDTLILKMNEVNINYSELQINDEAEEGEKGFTVKTKHDDYIIGKHNGVKYLIGHASLKIIKSQTPKSEIILVKEAHGGNKDAAKMRAGHIAYNVSQQDSLLVFDNVFTINSIDKLRGQDLTVILKIPVGQVVYLDKSLKDIIYDIENVTNTYDGDMINRRWIMTENGLKCIDCQGLDEDADDDTDNDNEDSNVNINVNGMKIDAKDSNIKIDSTGVNINSKDSKVTIDKNGVHINNKNIHNK